MAFIIILTGIWFYPIIGFLLVWLTRKRLKLRKKIFYFLIISSVLAILGIITNISTTSTFVDWLFVSFIYLTISFVLWWSQFIKNNLIKILGIIAISLTFSIGYILGSVGIIGLGFAISGTESINSKWIGNSLIYKEIPLGNAISDYRGKRVEIYKTSFLFPVIEWPILKKEYFNIITYKNKLNVNYVPEENKIILSATDKLWSGEIKKWSDTLALTK